MQQLEQQMKVQPDASAQSRITNVVATTVAIAGAIVASPVAMEKLPVAVVSILRTTTTLGNTTQPLVVTVIGIVLAAVTHPPAWLSGLVHGVRRRL
ncbi:MAG: hypothetical protein ABI035_13290 [Gemmatimonadaceae bacterium]